jgi:hypothetical protein
MRPTPLTDDEIADSYADATGFYLTKHNHTYQHLGRLDNLEFARAIEAEVNARWEKMLVAESSDTGLLDLLKEARKIIRSSSSRNLAKSWDERVTAAIAAQRGLK